MNDKRRQELDELAGQVWRSEPGALERVTPLEAEESAYVSRRFQDLAGNQTSLAGLVGELELLAKVKQGTPAERSGNGGEPAAMPSGAVDMLEALEAEVRKRLEVLEAEVRTRLDALERDMRAFHAAETTVPDATGE